MYMTVILALLPPWYVLQLFAHTDMQDSYLSQI